ncbi:DUF6266 family protein [Flavobacterium sp.]|uniref:DUF6266 family protein n=1 Tax=Flavobacterium sp. TaxID=239 RepID=UPI002617ED63|nr:DUF6266 family protein [Flavobacterium sp.]MDD3004539.1 DUF6266 family protein [Flavobacterium sp.]
MGRYNKGILGAFSGSVGPVVGINYRGADVLRSKPKTSAKPPTAKQLAQREKFAFAMQFLNPAKELLNTYYGLPDGTKSRYNMAVSYHLTEALFYADKIFEIAFDKVMYAKGTLLPAENLQASRVTDNTLLLTWTDNSQQADCKPNDQLMVVAYEPESKSYAFFMKAATRAAAETVLQLPASWNGKLVHLYGFMAAENGKSNSSSLYLGTV